MLQDWKMLVENIFIVFIEQNKHNYINYIEKRYRKNRMKLEINIFMRK